MSTALALSMVGTGIGVVLARLVVAVRGDGYGRRPPPRSERDWATWTENGE